MQADMLGSYSSVVEPARPQPVCLGLARPGQPADVDRLAPSLLDPLPRAPPRADLRPRTSRTAAVESTHHSERVELVAGSVLRGRAVRFEQSALALVVQARQVTQQRRDIEDGTRRRQDRPRWLNNRVLAARLGDQAEPRRVLGAATASTCASAVGVLHLYENVKRGPGDRSPGPTVWLRAFRPAFRRNADLPPRPDMPARASNLP